MSNRIVPRWLSRHWQIKALCVVLALILWLALKEETNPGTTAAIWQWLKR